MISIHDGYLLTDEEYEKLKKGVSPKLVDEQNDLILELRRQNKNQELYIKQLNDDIIRLAREINVLQQTTEVRSEKSFHIRSRRIMMWHGSGPMRSIGKSYDMELYSISGDTLKSIFENSPAGEYVVSLGEYRDIFAT